MVIARFFFCSGKKFVVVTKFLLPLGDIVKIREKEHQKDVKEVVSIKLCHVILKTMSWSTDCR